MHKDAIDAGHARADRRRSAGHRRHGGGGGAHGGGGGRQGGGAGLRGGADVPERPAKARRATTCSRCCSTTNEPPRAGRACARWPRSIWICACWASAPTATTSCAPSSRPFRWPTPLDDSRSRRRARRAIELDDDTGHPGQPGDAGGAAWRWKPCGATGRVEMRLDQAHPDGRGAGRRIVGRGGGAAGAAGAGGAAARTGAS